MVDSHLRTVTMLRMLQRDAAIATIRSNGMRLTPQRLAVIDAIIETAGAHPSADDIARVVGSHVSGVSLSTIYKVLGEIADLGLVHRVTIDGVVRFDENLDAHAHLRCEHCGALVDLDTPHELISSLHHMEKHNGVRASRFEVDLTGLCAACNAVA